ncbi:MAG: hypothetical protein M1829_003952 [Trizodia sp. TS-e1964]|nr:MAG: hypothetical protein M1829_003952 [Trizodia sp. TS-e1964]
MKTLCATSTLGVAAVGLSFGYLEPTPDIPSSTRPSNKRKANAVDGKTRVHHFRSSLVPVPAAHGKTMSSDALREEMLYATEGIEGRTIIRERRRARTEADGGQRSRALRPDTFLPSENLDVAASKASLSTARRSWLRRLSTLSNISNPSPSSNSTPTRSAADPPSVSVANTSVMPTNKASTVRGSMLPPLPPNKLVKRSSSFRLSTKETPRGQLRSQAPTFRRPATSHQRSATLQHQHLFDDVPAFSGIPDEEEEEGGEELPSSTSNPRLSLPLRNTPRWVSYFESEPTDAAKEAMPTIWNSTQLSSIRQISPDTKHIPTLVMAHTISPTKPINKEALIEGPESIDWDDPVTTPPSPSPITQDRMPHSSSPSQPSQRKEPEPPRRSDKPRISLFDWSEQLSIDKNTVHGSFPRPKTVHGKQGIEGRGGRSSSRRGPSPLHIRSQSVPVVPEVDGQREHSKGASRFATWGSKGVSEDWDGDFDFEASTTSNKLSTYSEETEKRVDSGIAMLVPQSIRERQASVLGHLGHVREFALLVEDLKRYRTLAASKNLIDGPSSSLWEEAEGIIALATLDDEDEIRPIQSPSSPGFGVDGFEDDPVQVNAQPRRKSVLSLDDENFGADGGINAPGDEPVTPRPPLTSSGVVGERKSSVASILGFERRASFHISDERPKIFCVNPERDRPVSLPANGERSDASAGARSVMETMHSRRTTSESALSGVSGKSRGKMQFDTTTLRDLVAHVSVLARSLAELVRDSEDSSSSPSQSPWASPCSNTNGSDSSPQQPAPPPRRSTTPPTPSFSHIFQENSPARTPSSKSSPTIEKRRIPRSKSINGVNGVNGHSNGTRTGKDKELGGRIHLMAVV